MAGLADFKIGQRVKLVDIQGGKSIIRRLLSLGLTVGNEVEIVQRRGGGVVLGKDGNRVALGGDIAANVVVEGLD